MEKNTPNALQTEYSALSLMLKHSDNRLRLESLTDSHFSDKRCLVIFQAIKLLEKQSNFINENNVIDQLYKMGDKTIILDNILKIKSMNSHSDSIEEYVHSLEQARLKRNIFYMGDKLKEETTKDLPYADIVIAVNSLVNDLQKDVHNSNKTMKEAQDELISKTEYRLKNKIEPITWGVECLDRIYRGVSNNLYMVAAVTSGGKTAFIIKLSIANAKKGKKVLVFSNEMSSTQLMQREMQREYGISYTSFDDGTITESQLGLVKNYKPSENLWINDSTNLDVDELCMLASLHKRKYGLDLITIDYLQILSTRKKIFDDNDRLKYISSKLRELQKTLDVPVISLVQYNKTVFNMEKPTPSLIMGSGQILFDAYSILLIHREEMIDKTILADKKHPKHGLVEFIIAKNRGGLTGTTYGKFIHERTDFIDYPNYNIYDDGKPHDYIPPSTKKGFTKG